MRRKAGAVAKKLTCNSYFQKVVEDESELGKKVLDAIFDGNGWMDR
jgi:hypothetical protein